jgi:hypothetical protein
LIVHVDYPHIAGPAFVHVGDFARQLLAIVTAVKPIECSMCENSQWLVRAPSEAMVTLASTKFMSERQKKEFTAGDAGANNKLLRPGKTRSK